MVPKGKLPKKGGKQHWPLIKNMNNIINKYGIISLWVQLWHIPWPHNMNKAMVDTGNLANYSVLVKSWLLEENLQPHIY